MKKHEGNMAEQAAIKAASSGNHLICQAAIRAAGGHASGMFYLASKLL
ncbi:hypothetical protein AAFO92_19090 [Roseovarius sp. CAU 1744]